MTRLRKKVFGEKKYINKKFGPLRVVYGQGPAHPEMFPGQDVYGADLTFYLGDYMLVFVIPGLHKSYVHKF